MKAKKQVKKKMRRGRPVAFSWAVGEKILDGIAGGASLCALCARPGFPKRDTVSGWVRRGAVGTEPDLHEFAKGFVLACKVRVALLEDDFVELIARIRGASAQELLGGAAMGFKLEMDGLKWYLGKFRPSAQLLGVDEALEKLDCAGMVSPLPADDEAVADRLIALKKRMADDGGGGAEDE